jgi:ABC-type sugar transport system ATPase subunit
MSSVSFKGVSKRFGTTEVIKNISLTVEDGEFLVFVGPSGCGKSTMLRMVAGLETISQGDLYIDGTRVNDLGPSERGAAMVFQSYALYPHMTVAENMSFGLRVAGLPKSEVSSRVQQTAEMLQITDLLNRQPKQLSGGQRQRVAIGRAIVRRPKVFLFDEPLSNLDASLRVQLRIELAKLHASLGTTMIYVTHDQTEAMTLGDRIAVFNRGKIEQLGTPLELYQNPANRFVAEFLGSPRINIIPYEWLGNGALRFAGNMTIEAVFFAQEIASLQGGTHIGIRPEHWEITAEETGISVKISLIEYLGDSTIIYANIEGSTDLFTLKRSIHQSTHNPGDTIKIRPLNSQSIVFNRDGNRIG